MKNKVGNDLCLEQKVDFNSYDKIYIAFSVDHTYVPYMKVSMGSILRNNINERIVFEILDVGLNEEDILSIRSFVGDYKKVELYIYNLKNIVALIGVKVPTFLDSWGAYGRLFLPDVLEDCDKVLYLDCDTLVVGGIRSLWNIDITEYYVAGVKDTTSEIYRRKIGLVHDDIYINSGVLLINLRAWRLAGIGKSVIMYISDNKDSATLPDQDGINIACKGKIQVLPSVYNVMSPVFLMPYENIIGYFQVQDYYSKEQIKNARKKPIIIHFTGYPDRRPWEKECKHPLTRLYMRYAVDFDIAIKTKLSKKSFHQRLTLFKFRWLPYWIYKKMKGFI